MHRSRISLLTKPLRALLALAVGIAALALIPGDVSAQATTTVSSPVDDEIAAYSAGAIALDPDGAPVIAYLNGQPSDTELRLARCVDLECTSTSAPQAIDVPLEDPTDMLFELTDMVIDEDGNPTIAADAGSLAYRVPYIIRCADPACASSTTHKLPVERQGVASSLALLPDGSVAQALVITTPVVLVICDTDGCTVGDELAHSGIDGSSAVDIAAGPDGSLVLASLDIDSEVLDVWRCTDTCGERSTISTVLGLRADEVLGDFHTVMDVGLDSTGFPIAAFASGDFLLCNDPACADDDDQLVRPDPLARTTAKDVALLLPAGQPPVMVIDYTGPQRGSIRVLACLDPTCETGVTNRLTPEADRFRLGERFQVDAVLSADDRPLILWNRYSPQPTDTALLVARCANTICGVESTCDGAAVTVTLSEGQSPTDGPDVILGTDGADVIGAAGGDDLICGLGGDDLIWGQAGDDVIFGHDGDDRLRGGPGDDAILAGSGSDNAAGGTGDDLVEGGPGDDEALRGGTGDDTLRGDDGDDQLINGNGGEDLVIGNHGNDRLLGGPRADRLVGWNGDDILKGNGGADQLEGGRDNDQLFGGPGNDMLDGGKEDDVCNGGTSGPFALEFDQVTNCESLVNIP